MVNTDVAQRSTTAAPVASFRTNLVTLLLSLWFAGGLFLDVWAHNNVPQLETFFTPWHAVFYSGFAATAGWILWTCRSVLQERRWDAGIPAGYAPALVSLGAFALAGAGDLIWHGVFGIEQSINILFSPTHLALGVSMLIIVTTPLRSASADPSLPRSPGLRRLLPAVGSLALATTIVLLFLQYANAFAFSRAGAVVALSGVDLDRTAALVSSIAMTNLVLLIPVLIIAARWTLPLGGVTLLYLPVALLAGAVTSFGNVALLVGLLAAGVATDLLGRWLDPAPERPRRFWAFAALVPLVTWTIFVGIAAATPRPTFLAPDGSAHGTDGVIELYTGVPLVQALLGLLVGILMLSRIDATARG
jgi:hypothetical protein